MHRELIKLLSVLILHDVSPCAVIPCHNVTPTRKSGKTGNILFYYLHNGWVGRGRGGGRGGSERVECLKLFEVKITAVSI